MNGVTETLATPPRRWLRPMILAAVVAVLGIGANRWFLRLEVEGNSMIPTLLPGDRLLFRRITRPSGLSVGVIVALHDPRPGEDRLIVKRITAITNGEATVRGDNPAASTDSRDFGPVALNRLPWKLVRRYNRVHGGA